MKRAHFAAFTLLLTAAGCHFRAGFGPAPAPDIPPSTDHTTIRDTTHHADGSRTLHETVTDKTTHPNGKSTTVNTETTTRTDPEGKSTTGRTVTTTERDRFGTVTTSSSSGSR